MPVSGDLARYRAMIHYVGHLDATNPALTPRETLGFWATLRGASTPDIETALDRFGLAAIADWPCRFLSAGQRRRLALARLVAVPAAIWLLDEPNTALDRDGEARLAAAVAAHRAAGGRVAIATHQPIALDGAILVALDEFAVSADQALAALW